jgi:Uma2 family endonuclease
MNPVVVIEVLSPSREGDDRGKKRRDFQSLASLQAYVLAAQDERCVKVHRRAPGGAWRDEPDVYGNGQTFDVPALTTPIAVADVHEGILDADGCSRLR